MKLVSINDFVYRVSDGDYHLIEKNAEFDNFDSFLMTIQKKYRPLYRLDYMVRYD